MAGIENISIVWLRRDIRLSDNTALYKALAGHTKVLLLYIFDDNILSGYSADDARITFIYDSLKSVHEQLAQHGSSLLVRKGKPRAVFQDIMQCFSVEAVYANKEYEPYSIKRDAEIHSDLAQKGIAYYTFKDQVIFEEREILTAQDAPYTVFTPYKKKWLSQYFALPAGAGLECSYKYLYPILLPFPAINELGFRRSCISVKPYSLSGAADYGSYRDFPERDTSNISPYLRYGTVSIRDIVAQSVGSADYLNELIWREFFMQIMFHFPHSVERNFKPKYDGVAWRNDTAEYEAWCSGQTGYPLVDAGMRQLNSTGYMHNRVRMVAASFLCKHLLIDWRWGEAYFAQHLIDFELSSNVGNWQWSAGTGCDAAPYFRIFNPIEQQKKYDPGATYIRKWVEDFDMPTYPAPIVDHSFARKRALETYKSGLEPQING